MNKIYLSPSVQDGNIGAGNYGSESFRMNQIADVVERELKKSSQFTIYRNKKTMSLAEIVNESNNNKCDIHFAIHSNAGGGRGCEVYAYSQGTNGDRIANLLYKRIAAITPSGDRGLKYDQTFYELKATVAPAAIAEIAFHDNLEDANWIINNIELIGIELAKAIYEYFGVPYVEPPKTLYRVQVGAFAVRENAEKLKAELISKGYGAIIV